MADQHDAIMDRLEDIHSAVTELKARITLLAAAAVVGAIIIAAARCVS